MIAPLLARTMRRLPSCEKETFPRRTRAPCAPPASAKLVITNKLAQANAATFSDARNQDKPKEEVMKLEFLFFMAYFFFFK
jgi:hypothetical protein